MQPFRHHVIVCTQQKPENVPCCAAANSAAVLGALYGETAKQGVADDVIISTTGCLGACDYGPVIVVYPEGVWYGGVKAADVPELVASHLRDGRPVERLMLTDMAALRSEVLDHRRKFYAMTAAKDAAGILPDDINNLARAFWDSRALLTGLELDIFTAIGSGATAAEVANKIDADARATEMLLHALAALGLLEKRDGRFHNTANAARFLTGDSRTALMHTVNLWDRWSTLTECVRAGTSVARQQGVQRSEDQTRAFIAAMHRNAAERAPLVVRAVGNGYRRMLDLGGGSGAYSIAFAKTNPELRAEVLDTPAVLPLTQEYVRQAGLSDRVATRPGDMLTTSLGSDHDFILLSAICHMFSPEQNRALLRRACEALAPGGRLVVQDFILEPDKTAPRWAALFSLNMLVGTEGGASYSAPEYADWLHTAGFSKVEHVRLPGPSSLMVATR